MHHQGKQKDSKRFRRQAASRPSTSNWTLADFRSRHDEVREQFVLAGRFAAAEAPILIEGETGVGKSALADAIVSASGRADRPYVRVRCSEIPSELLANELFGHRRGAFTGADRDRKGRIEAAHGGTVLLDEIGELPPRGQKRLLGVLHDGVLTPMGTDAAEVQVDVRIIAATKVDLDRAVAKGKFRDDLLHRLNTLRLRLPLLRERPRDIVPLARRMLRRLAADPGRHGPISLAPDAEVALRRYRWPGNLRELRNALERALAVSRGSVLAASDLEPDLQKLAELPTRDEWIEFSERDYYELILRRTGGSVSEAAKIAGKAPRTVGERLKVLGIDWREFRPGRGS